MADSTPGAPLADNAIGVPVSRAKAEPYGMFSLVSLRHTLNAKYQAYFTRR